MSATLPSHTNVLIIGGGIAGCSVAYHLTRIGIRDVVPQVSCLRSSSTTSRMPIRVRW